MKVWRQTRFDGRIAASRAREGVELADRMCELAPKIKRVRPWFSRRFALLTSIFSAVHVLGCPRCNERNMCTIDTCRSTLTDSSSSQIQIQAQHPLAVKLLLYPKDFVDLSYSRLGTNGCLWNRQTRGRSTQKDAFFSVAKRSELRSERGGPGRTPQDCQAAAPNGNNT